jgi:uncharacterized protein YdeI (YjbR/CyaY-like superfamily)
MAGGAGNDLPILSFESAETWERWLEEHHTSSSGIWLRFFKKDSNIDSINHEEALDLAICFGWIDGQLRPHDDESYLQRFTPRRPKSIWSKRNRQHAERLAKQGKMRAAGLKEVETAKADGRWEKAYDSPAAMTIPDDFLNELAKNDRARAFFSTLNKTNLYSIGWRLQTSKRPETRKKWMEKIIAMLERGEKFH